MQFEEKGAIKLLKQPDHLIYFLIKDSEVVYIGETNNSVARPAAHKDKDYDSFFILPAPQDKKERLKLERTYIAKYLPKYNGINFCEGYRAEQSRLRQYCKLDKFQLYFYNVYNKWKLDLGYIKQIIETNDIENIMHEGEFLFKRDSTNKLAELIIHQINKKLEENGVILNDEEQRINKVL